MIKAKAGKPMKEIVEKAKSLRDLQAAAIENQVYDIIQPEIREHILSSINKQALEEARLNELRSDIEDDLENPIPAGEDYDEDDTLDVERGSEAEGLAGGEGELGAEESSDELANPIPTSDELDGGVDDVLKIEVDGVTFEAEYSPGDNKIVFINPEAPPEEGGEFGETDISDESEEDLEGSPEEGFEGEEDFEFDFDGPPEEEEEEFETNRLRKEIHNRIAKKSRSGVSKEQVLEEYRQLIRKQLLAELSTNQHDEKKKPVRKVTVEEKLASKNLIPKKYSKSEVLNENDTKWLHNRYAQLCNL